MMRSLTVIFLLTSAMVSGQRPSFAGFRPIGYPEVDKTTTTADPLSDRFGEDTTQRLPAEANGDRDLIDRLSKLPIDKQPFWFINWQAIEAHRNQSQTYPQRPSIFVDSQSSPNVPVSPNIQNFSNGNQASAASSQGFSSNPVVLNDNQAFSNPSDSSINAGRNPNTGFINAESGNAIGVFTNPNSGVTISSSGLPTGSNGLANPITQYPTTTTGFVNPNPPISRPNPGNLIINSRIPVSNPILTTNAAFASPNLVSSTTNSGPTTSVPSSPTINSRFSTSGFSRLVTAVNTRFEEVPHTTNPSYNYSWNKTYHHETHYRHKYNTTYFVPNVTKLPHLN